MTIYDHETEQTDTSTLAAVKVEVQIIFRSGRHDTFWFMTDDPMAIEKELEDILSKPDGVYIVAWCGRKRIFRVAEIEVVTILEGELPSDNSH